MALVKNVMFSNKYNIFQSVEIDDIKKVLDDIMYFQKNKFWVIKRKPEINSKTGVCRSGPIPVSSIKWSKDAEHGYILERLDFYNDDTSRIFYEDKRVLEDFATRYIFSINKLYLID